MQSGGKTGVKVGHKNVTQLYQDQGYKLGGQLFLLPCSGFLIEPSGNTLAGKSLNFVL